MRLVSNNLFLKIAFFTFFFIFIWSKVSAAGKININTANIQELQEINGIGPVIAERIIKMRNDCYFYPLASLIKVERIGPITLKKIEEEGKAFVEPPENSQNIVFCQDIKKETEISVPPPEQNQEKSNPSEPDFLEIDVNTASLEDLTKISQIGEARAKELISLRPLYSLDDLIKIKGIGNKTLEEIKNQGIAWIDPKLEVPETEKENSGYFTASISSFNQENPKNKESKSFFIFFISSALAVFSGVIILILKKNLNLFL
jgi:DNA uptake protein ComE-like DNA-binding protein